MAARGFWKGFVAFAMLSGISMVAILYSDPWGIRGGMGTRSMARLALGCGAVLWGLTCGFLIYFRILGRQARIAFCAILAVFGCLLLAVWPGFYIADSFAQIGAARFLPIDAGLGPITPIVSHAILQHVPKLGALPFVQALFFSLAIATAVQFYTELGRHMLPSVLLAGWVVLSPPILFTVLLVSRDSWLAILSIFMVVEAARFWTDPDWSDGRVAARLLGLCVFAWIIRIDGALYGLLALVVLAGRWWWTRGVDGHGRRLEFWRAALIPPAVLALACLVLTRALVPGIVHGSYAITLWINPVGYIIQHDRAGISPTDLALVNAAVPLRGLKGDGPDVGMDAYWYADDKGAVSVPAQPAERAALHGAALRIIRQHPALWVENRWRVFEASNYPSPGGAVWANQSFVDDAFVQRTMTEWSGPSRYVAKFPAARSAIEQAFFATTISPFGRLQWAFWPELLAMVAVLVLAWKAMPGMAMAAALLLVRMPVLFLIAPESQVKYYASLEFAAPVVVFVVLARWLDGGRDDGGKRLPARQTGAGLSRVSQAAIARFGFVSLIGWFGDFVLFAGLTAAGFAPFLANSISAAAAVSFVYFASVRRVFRYRGQFLFAKFVIYCLYQIVAVLAASWCVQALAYTSHVPPLFAKIAVTPFTFLANFLFMNQLTRPASAVPKGSVTAGDHA